MPARPGDGQAPDPCVVPKAEVQDRLGAGQDAAGEHERPDLDAGIRLDAHGRADAVLVRTRSAKRYDDAVPRVRVVSKERHAPLEVRVDNVEVAVAVQVAERGAKADALLVEPPGGAYVLEAQVAHVAERQVLLD